MAITVEAVYENGTLKLTQLLPLKEQERVRVTVETQASPILEAYGIIGWKGDHETLERFALDPELDPQEGPSLTLADGTLVPLVVTPVDDDDDPLDAVIGICTEGPDVSLAERHDEIISAVDRVRATAGLIGWTGDHETLERILAEAEEMP